MDTLITTIDKFWSSDFWKELDGTLLRPSSIDKFDHVFYNRLDHENRSVFDIVAPGFDKKDFKITTKQNRLIVSCDVAKETETNAQKYSRREWVKHSFRKELALNSTHDVDSITAEYKNGILRIEGPTCSQTNEKSKIIEVK